MEQSRDGHLVVGAQDGPTGVAEHPFFKHRLDEIRRLDRIEVGPERQMRLDALSLDGAPQIAGRSPDGLRGVVLVDRHAKSRQSG